MLNKSIRPTRDDAVGIQKIIECDMRVEKSPSEALFYAYKDAACSIPDWNTVKKLKFDNGDEPNEQFYGRTMSFMVDENDFEIVVESLKRQLNLEKVRISYMTRLCILAARTKLENANSQAIKETKTAKENMKVEVQKLDGVELLRKVNEKAAKLIIEGNTEKIFDFLKED